LCAATLLLMLMWLPAQAVTQPKGAVNARDLGRMAAENERLVYLVGLTVVILVVALVVLAVVKHRLVVSPRVKRPDKPVVVKDAWAESGKRMTVESGKSPEGGDADGNDETKGVGG